MRRRRWTRKRLVCLLAARAAAAAASSDSITGSAKPSIFRTFLFLAHKSQADQNPTTIKNTDEHVTHLPLTPPPAPSFPARRQRGGWGRKETPGDARASLPSPHPTRTGSPGAGSAADSPLPPTQTHRHPRSTRYVTSPPPPVRAGAPSPRRAARWGGPRGGSGVAQRLEAPGPGQPRRGRYR